MYDVAIIGAGPAGATAARFLAQSGVKVCLIDKDEFPRDKPCGGGFSYDLLHDFRYLASREDEFLKGICRVGVIHSPNRRTTLKGRVDMAVALRFDFDRVLFDAAIEVGAEPLTGQRVKGLSIEEDGVKVVTDSGEIHSRVIIGADGASSLVARTTGLNRKWQSSQITACRVVEVPALEKEIVDLYTPEFEYHFFLNLGGQPGYGWIFPKRNSINVGLGIVGTHSKGLPDRFIRFVRYLKSKRLLTKNADLSFTKGALVPTGGAIEKSYFNRCLLVGDSAGMVSPITGGGIAYAMRAARIASRVILNGLEEDRLDENYLSRYQRLWEQDFGSDFGSQLIAQRLFTSSFADLLFEIGKRDVVLQNMVTEAMAESLDEQINVRSLALRAFYVCFRQAFHLGFFTYSFESFPMRIGALFPIWVVLTTAHARGHEHTTALRSQGHL
ncbi:MAG: NAD(P)/FAD-dependent oxidoreductase [Candidatus Hodarchaeota archaeon]